MRITFFFRQREYNREHYSNFLYLKHNQQGMTQGWWVMPCHPIGLSHNPSTEWHNEAFIVLCHLSQHIYVHHPKAIKFTTKNRFITKDTTRSKVIVLIGSLGGVGARTIMHVDLTVMSMKQQWQSGELSCPATSRGSSGCRPMAW
jgi:hypothetical protein